jgi:hypothetical protein
MNVTSTIHSHKKVITHEIHEHCCENIANSITTFNRLLTNISNKLGLSKAIYQK